MISILDLNMYARIAIAVGAAVTFFALFVAWINSFQQGQSFFYSTVIFLIMVTNFYFLQELAQVYNNRRETIVSSILLDYPWYISLEIVAVFLSLALALIVINLEYNRNHVSILTIKDSFDQLDDGNLFYDEDGFIFLANRQINELCRRVTGEALINGNRFYEDLVEGKVRAGIQTLENAEIPLFILPDGTVYFFQRYLIERNDERLYQIVATDITEEYHLIETNEDIMQQINSMNVSLKEYRTHVGEQIVRREILEAKQNVHDKLGQMLIITRQLIEKGGSKEEVASSWRNTLRMILRQNDNREETQGFAELEEAGKSIGVEMVINGELPEDKEIARIFRVATTETLLNASKFHARHLYINIKREGNLLYLSYENDGDAPTHEIVEGGGFSMIRSNVEEAMGEMHITSLPKFRLDIVLRA